MLCIKITFVSYLLTQHQALSPPSHFTTPQSTSSFVPHVELKGKFCSGFSGFPFDHHHNTFSPCYSFSHWMIEISELNNNPYFLKNVFHDLYASYAAKLTKLFHKTCTLQWPLFFKRK